MSINLFEIIQDLSYAEPDSSFAALTPFAYNF
jgi:hypothetical protein